ncbi:hypothetical protein [Fibrella aquatilis]|uniref:Uncharacterized protein n=1 Tax=Fibrella aquatilis TaxID=2817059 RepID=A0A939G8E6_9BACT|nr:hypothetical protein [Fibrella aquatilis]MBO0931683.1 hypothetical protein [Fibrella aquatilis]
MTAMTEMASLLNDFQGYWYPGCRLSQPDLLQRPANLTPVRQALLDIDDVRRVLCQYYPTTQFNRRHQLYRNCRTTR